MIGFTRLVFRAASLPEVSVAAVTLALLLVIPRLTRRIPAPLIAITVSSVAVALIHRYVPSFSVATIGTRFHATVTGHEVACIPPVSGGEYRAPSSAVAIRGHVEPQVVPAGGTAKLVLEAIPDKDYHVYAVPRRDSVEGRKTIKVLGLNQNELPLERGHLVWDLITIADLMRAGLQKGNKIIVDKMVRRIAEQTTAKQPFAGFRRDFFRKQLLDDYIAPD